MKVLILSTKYGNGHHSIATQLKSYFEHEGDEVKVVNPHRDKNYYVTRFVEKVYTDIFCRYAHIKPLKILYAISFELFGNRFPNIFSRFGTKQIKQLTDKYQPDLVIRTFPMHLPQLDMQVVTLITDYGLSNVWMSQHNDVYIVGSEQVKAQLVKHGAKQPVLICGIPVNPGFYQVNNKCKLENIVFNMGVVGNGKVEHLKQEIIKLAQNGIKCEIICGHNKRLYNKLIICFKNIENIYVHGFVSDMQAVYARNDLLVSKAGGITIAEAIASETPILINKKTSMSGQEAYNIKFIKEVEIGAVYSGYGEIIEAIWQLLENNTKYEQFVLNMQALKCEYQADMINISEYLASKKEANE